MCLMIRDGCLNTVPGSNNVFTWSHKKVSSVVNTRPKEKKSLYYKTNLQVWYDQNVLYGFRYIFII